MLRASTIGIIIYFILELTMRRGYWNQPPSIWVEAPMSLMFSILFSSAVVINIFNWIYQTIKIKSIQNGRYQNQVIIHILFAFLILSVFLTYMGFVVASWVLDSDEDLLLRVFTLTYWATFLLIGCSFIFVGINFYHTFKETCLKKQL